MCLHETIDGNQCDSCGMIVKPRELANCWVVSSTPQTKSNTKKKLAAEINTLVKLDPKISKIIVSTIRAISARLKINIKGKRKRSIILIKLWDLDKTINFDKMANRFGLSQKDVNKGILLYEELTTNLNFSWVDLLKRKLNEINMIDHLDLIYKELYSSKSNINTKSQIEICITKYCQNNNLSIPQYESSKKWTAKKKKFLKK